MLKPFSPQTLEKFEDASASIPLRQLIKAFEAVDIRMAADPGGSAGSRRTQFRRYVAGVDQHDPPQLARLGAAFGALIAEVADSKVEFLVTAAEGDGFSFADGAFHSAETTPISFALTSREDLATIDERGKRLRLLANDRPEDAIDGATELVESLCRTVLRLLGAEPPKKAARLAEIATITLDSLGPLSARTQDASEVAELVRTCVRQLSAVVMDLGQLRALSPTHARLAVSVALAFADFVVETYFERSPGR